MNWCEGWHTTLQNEVSRYPESQINSNYPIPCQSGTHTDDMSEYLSNDPEQENEAFLYCSDFQVVVDKDVIKQLFGANSEE